MHRMIPNHIPPGIPNGSPETDPEADPEAGISEVGSRSGDSRSSSSRQSVVTHFCGWSVVAAKSIHQAVDAQRMDGRSAAIDGCGR